MKGCINEQRTLNCGVRNFIEPRLPPDPCPDSYHTNSNYQHLNQCTGLGGRGSAANGCRLDSGHGMPLH